jgi:hypothetical protein
MGERTAADSTAVRVAWWWALHVQVDSPPHVLRGQGLVAVTIQIAPGSATVLPA